MLFETVGQTGPYVVRNVVLAIDWEIGIEAVWTNVVDSSNMVVVAVGNKERVDVVVGSAEHLLAEVGSAIDEYRYAFHSDYCRGSEPTVVRVGRCAGIALATYNRHSG